MSHSIPDGWPRDDAPFTFVTEGVERAVALAKEVAGAETVGVAGPDVAQQCLDAGSLDEIDVELIPVQLGEGIRFFDHVANAPVMLEDPDRGGRQSHDPPPLPGSPLRSTRVLH